MRGKESWRGTNSIHSAFFNTQVHSYPPILSPIPPWPKERDFPLLRINTMSLTLVNWVQGVVERDQHSSFICHQDSVFIYEVRTWRGAGGESTAFFGNYWNYGIGFKQLVKFWPLQFCTANSLAATKSGAHWLHEILVNTIKVNAVLVRFFCFVNSLEVNDLVLLFCFVNSLLLISKIKMLCQLNKGQLILVSTVKVNVV